MKKSLSLMVALLVLSGSLSLFGQAGATAEKLTPTGSYVVYAQSPQAFRFSYDPKTMGNASVTGHFSVTKGTPNNIEVMVWSEDAYMKWRTGDDAAKAAAKPLYTSGRKTEGDVSVKLTDGGFYYLTLSNSFQYDGMKSVTADIKFQYDKK